MSDERDALHAVYGWRTLTRWLFLVTMPLVTAAVLWMLLGGILGSDRLSARVVIFTLVGVGWVVLAVLMLWRVALTLELTATELRWRGAIRSGELPLAGITGLRPVPVLAFGGIHALTVADRPALWVIVARGFGKVVEDVQEAGAKPEIRLSRAVGSLDRLPGRPKYYRIG